MQDSLERCPVGRKETAMGNSPKKHHTWAHETLMCTRFRSFRMCLSETLVGTVGTRTGTALINSKTTRNQNELLRVFAPDKN